jgi:hypothetical protein
MRMLAQALKPLVRLVDRYLPDAAPDDGKIERSADRLETSRSVSWLDPEPT